jgi:hypothetical protein
MSRNLRITALLRGLAVEKLPRPDKNVIAAHALPSSIVSPWQSLK